MFKDIRVTNAGSGAGSRAVCDQSSDETLDSNPAGAWMPLCCECCVFSGRGLCVGLITRPEKSYRL